MVLVAVAGAGACSSSSKPSAASVSTSTTTTTTTTKSGAPGSFAELEARIITNVPSGFARQPDAKYDTGPSDLAKAVRDDGSKGAEKALTEEGFVGGYQRLWLGPAKAQIIVFIDQFRSAAGARADYRRGVGSYYTRPPKGTQRFTVPGFPSSRAIGIAGAEKDGAVAVAYFTTGVFNVEMDCNGPTLAGLEKRVNAVAADQAKRLSS
jgi:hypothetical protein